MLFLRQCVTDDLLEPGDCVRSGHVPHCQAAAELHCAAYLQAVVAWLAGDHAGGLGHHPLHPLHPDTVLDGAPPVAHCTRVLAVICLSVVLNKIFSSLLASFTTPNLNNEFSVPVYPDCGVEAAVPASLLQRQPVLGPGYIGAGTARVVRAEQLDPVAHVTRSQGLALRLSLLEARRTRLSENNILRPHFFVQKYQATLSPHSSSCKPLDRWQTRPLDVLPR